MDDRRDHTSRSNERGTTLVEVLIAMFVLLVLVLGVLNLFSVALAMNLGSAARTELTYKAVDVIEILRYANSPEAPAGWAAQAPLAPDGEYALPTVSTDAGWGFWGPALLNVVEEEQAPYRMFYRVTDAGPEYQVIVRAVPSDVVGARQYQGMGVSKKEIDYAAAIPKP